MARIPQTYAEFSERYDDAWTAVTKGLDPNKTGFAHLIVREGDLLKANNARKGTDWDMDYDYWPNPNRKPKRHPDLPFELPELRDDLKRYKPSRIR